MVLETCRNCAIEGNPSKPLLRCSRCKAAFYCSQDCQKADLRRHRRDDDCGTKPVAAPLPTEASARTHETVAAPPVPGVRCDAQVDGPRCLRCRGAAGEVYASVVRNSIFAEDCAHGPYCARCADRMQRHTLPFCHGCSALVDCFQHPGRCESSDGATAIAAGVVDSNAAANAAAAAVAAAAATLPGTVSLDVVD